MQPTSVPDFSESFVETGSEASAVDVEIVSSFEFFTDSLVAFVSFFSSSQSVRCMVLKTRRCKKIKVPAIRYHGHAAGSGKLIRLVSKKAGIIETNLDGTPSKLTDWPEGKK